MRGPQGTPWGNRKVSSIWCDERWEITAAFRKGKWPKKEGICLSLFLFLPGKQTGAETGNKASCWEAGANICLEWLHLHWDGRWMERQNVGNVGRWKHAKKEEVALGSLWVWKPKRKTQQQFTFERARRMAVKLGREGKKEIMKQLVAGCDLGVRGISGQKECRDTVLQMAWGAVGQTSESATYKAETWVKIQSPAGARQTTWRSKAVRKASQRGSARRRRQFCSAPTDGRRGRRWIQAVGSLDFFSFFKRNHGIDKSWIYH